MTDPPLIPDITIMVGSGIAIQLAFTLTKKNCYKTRIFLFGEEKLIAPLIAFLPDVDFAIRRQKKGKKIN